MLHLRVGDVFEVGMVAGQVQCGDTFGNRTIREDGRLGATIRLVPLAEPPIEVAQTLARILAGGPFPYSKAGQTVYYTDDHYGTFCQVVEANGQVRER